VYFQRALSIGLLCILFVTLCLPIRASASSEWSIQIVDSSGFDGSIALDSNDNPHISYSSSNGSKYAILAGLNWTIQTSVGSGSLSLDSSSNPHIVYPSNVGTGLMYAFWVGSNWEIQAVDSSENFTLGYSMALDSNGYPHIAYHDASNPVDNNGLRYAFWAGSNWVTQIVD